MSNRQELLRARQALEEAQAALEAIQHLPRRKGARVRWSNGVIWERYGDDDWRPVAHIEDGEEVPTDARLQEQPYSSKHIAMIGSWERVS